MSETIDPERCIEIVTTYATNWPKQHQCSRKKAVGDYCKQHDPKAVEARREKQSARYKAERQKYLTEMRGPAYKAALIEIASGKLNDPAGFAAMQLERIDR